MSQTRSELILDTLATTLSRLDMHVADAISAAIELLCEQIDDACGAEYHRIEVSGGH